jgi:hypothetical protein
MRKFVLIGLALLATGLWVGCGNDDVTTPPQLVQTEMPELTAKAQGGLIQVDLGVRASVHVEAEASGCSNNPGPFITLTGEVALGGVDAQLIFRNADKGPHERTEDVEASVVLLPAGETIRFAKQPPQRGACGKPWIYLVFTDHYGNEYGDPVLLGRCVQGFNTYDLDFAIPSTAWAEIVTGGCSNSPGPYITLEGELALGGLNAKLIFTNNRRFTHVHAEDIVVDIVLLDAGETITFAKQPPLGGVGGNPKIWLQFTDENGGGLSDEIYLGRCVQLGK